MRYSIGFLVVAMLIAGCTQAGAQTGTSDQPAKATDQSTQRVVLDPDTGQRVAHPPASEAGDSQDAPSDTASPPSAHQTRRESPYQSWTTDDGVPMLAVDPSGSPHLRVVRCDNGRLISAEQSAAACGDHAAPSAD